MLHERLRDGAVHVVMAHVIADAVRAPAERELRKIARPEDDRLALVGEAEKIIGAKSRLHVLERDVVDVFALGERMAQVLEHLARGGTYVDLLAGHAEGMDQLPGVGFRARRGREARQVEGEDVLAGKAQRIEYARRDEERMGRIEAARDSDHGVLQPGRLHPFREPLYLDVECLVAITVEALRVVGHEGKACDSNAASHASPSCPTTRSAS